MERRAHMTAYVDRAAASTAQEAALIGLALIEEADWVAPTTARDPNVVTAFAKAPTMYLSITGALRAPWDAPRFGVWTPQLGELMLDTLPELECLDDVWQVRIAIAVRDAGNEWGPHTLCTAGIENNAATYAFMAALSETIDDLHASPLAVEVRAPGDRHTVDITLPAHPPKVPEKHVPLPTSPSITTISKPLRDALVDLAEADPPEFGLTQISRIQTALVLRQQRIFTADDLNAVVWTALPAAMLRRLVDEDDYRPWGQRMIPAHGSLGELYFTSMERALASLAGVTTDDPGPVMDSLAWRYAERGHYGILQRALTSDPEALTTRIEALWDDIDAARNVFENAASTKAALPAQGPLP